MRTRIALVAIIPIAFITVILLTLAATALPARASTRPTQPRSAHRTDRLASFVTRRSPRPTALPEPRVPAAWLSASIDWIQPVAPVVPPPAPALVDTVTPAQRAAWDRVAMCEEGGNWQANGPRFSGGLGITRANWSAYGGRQYAPVASLATPDQQIMVAQRIQGSPPDQRGCSSW